MKKSSIKYSSSSKNIIRQYVDSIDVWKTHDCGKPLSEEAVRMLDKSLFELWDTLQEAVDFAVLIGADLEQYRAEIRQLIEMIEPKKS